jgi:limonene-1,2-epoxide hydrolase
MSPLPIAQAAFHALIHGLQTGQWHPFCDRLSDQVTIWFPQEPFAGINHGKERAIALLQSIQWDLETAIAIDHITCNGTTVMLELRLDHPGATLPGFERAAISFEIQDDKVAAIVPYLLLDHPAKRE